MEELSTSKEEERRKEQERHLEERFSVLKTREYELFTFKWLEHVADAFIKYLEEHREEIVARGEVERASPPRISWFTERLGRLYPDYHDSRLGFRVEPKIREGLLEIRILVLRELIKVVNGYASRGAKTTANDEVGNFKYVRLDSANLGSDWIEVVRSGLESNNLDPRDLLELDRRYIRLNLFRKPPPGYARIRSGGLLDLVEVIGRYAKLMDRNGTTRVAETLESAGLLGWDENQGAPWLKFKTFSRIPKYKHESLIQATLQLAATEYSERSHEPMFNIFVEMNKQQVRQWTEFDLWEQLDLGKDDPMAPRHYWIRLNAAFFGPQLELFLFAPSKSILERLVTDFVERNSMIQQRPGGTIWRISFEGSKPFRVKNAGLKCIAYLFRHPDESIHYTSLGAIMGPPDILLRTDLDFLGPKLVQNHIELGTHLDGETAWFPAYGRNLLIAGPSGSGKSTFATKACGGGFYGVYLL